MAAALPARLLETLSKEAAALMAAAAGRTPGGGGGALGAPAAAAPPTPTMLLLSRLGLTPLYGGGFLVAFAQAATFYYLVAALLCWIVPRLLPVRGIQPSPPRPGDLARDAKGSLGPLAVKAAIWALVEQLHARGWAPMLYTGAMWPPPVLVGFGGARGGAAAAGGARAATAAAASPSSTPIKGAVYAALCVFALDLLHDAWFYWTHRLLHWRPLYRTIHRDHHLSRAPTPFTGYSFHVLEAALVFANEVLVCFLLPLHLGLHRVYHLLTGAVHQAGHAGYEMAPFIPTVEGLAAYAVGGVVGAARAAGRAVAGAARGTGATVAAATPASPAASDDGKGGSGVGKRHSSGGSFFIWAGGLWSPAPSLGSGGGASSSSSDGGSDGGRSGDGGCAAGEAAPAAAVSPSVPNTAARTLSLTRALSVTRAASSAALAAAASSAASPPPPNPLLNTVQHHDLHHRYPRMHFSLYFTHWDRLCGTLHPEYDAGLFKYGGGDEQEEEQEDEQAAAVAGGGEGGGVRRRRR